VNVHATIASCIPVVHWVSAAARA